MELLLLGVYGLVVWLVFFKFELLIWTKTWMVVVISIPVIFLFVLVQLLNIYTPATGDVRVINYVVQVVPQVSGQVVDVAARGNVLVASGEPLLRIDPTPYEMKVRELESQLIGAKASSANLTHALDEARNNTAAARTRLTLARRRLVQNEELVKAGAGSRFDLEAAQAEAQDAEAALNGTRAKEKQVIEQIGAQVDGDQAEVAALKARLEEARWNVEKTTYRAPAAGYPINVQVRPGSFAAALPFKPVMSFVEKEQSVVGLYDQNQLHAVQPGDEVELALETLPGMIIKAKVDSVIWAQGQGQLPPSGDLPDTSTQLPPGRYAVKFHVEDEDVFLAAGARGTAAIFTQHAHPVHLIRKVLMRVKTKLNYLIMKLH